MCNEGCMKNMNEITDNCSNLGVTELYKQFCDVMNETMSKSLRSRKIILRKNYSRDF